jgi:hypothetical protein
LHTWLKKSAVLPLTPPTLESSKKPKFPNLKMLPRAEAQYHGIVYDDQDDSHVSTFDENNGTLVPATWAAVFFLGLTFQAFRSLAGSQSSFQSRGISKEMP